VEQAAVNRKVLGSSPSSGATFLYTNCGSGPSSRTASWPNGNEIGNGVNELLISH